MYIYIRTCKSRMKICKFVSSQYRRASRSSDIMYSSFLRLCLTVFVPYVTAQQTIVNTSFRGEKILHAASELNDVQLSKLASMSNITHMDEALDNICILRVVGTPGHARVKGYLKNSMQDLGWNVESDIFNDKPPNFGTLQFENIIAKLNPDARRYLVLACHYDSKYTRERDFVGATDSAVPCAQLLNLATVMKEQLDPAKTNNVSLMFIFFDGEEAFHRWGPTDSIYGARNLAHKWHNIRTTYGTETDISELDKMDMLMLLDLLGASDPTFYSYFPSTERWYSKLINAERALARLGKFQGYTNENGDLKYFLPYPANSGVEDDHIPFLRRGVPILHLIPSSFPSVWHTPGDNRSIVDMDTTENLNKILRVFVASYLNLDV